MQLTDTFRHYGLVSRALHWGMAILFAWQFGGMALKSVVGRTPLMGFWVGTHASVGTLLLGLIFLRACWAVAQWKRRPAYQEGWLGRAASLGHLALYVLMLLVPFMALMRMFGAGRGVRLFGVQIRQASNEAVTWMTAPADFLHGNLAWLLLALVAGHIFMVFVHRYWLGEDVLSRMTGRHAAGGG